VAAAAWRRTLRSGGDQMLVGRVVDVAKTRSGAPGVLVDAV